MRRYAYGPAHRTETRRRQLEITRPRIEAKKQQFRTHKYRKDVLTPDKPLGHKAFRITPNGD
jgi:hypothetical protein